MKTVNIANSSSCKMIFKTITATTTFFTEHHHGEVRPGLFRLPDPLVAPGPVPLLRGHPRGRPDLRPRVRQVREEARLRGIAGTVGSVGRDESVGVEFSDLGDWKTLLRSVLHGCHIVLQCLQDRGRFVCQYVQHMLAFS